MNLRFLKPTLFLSVASLFMLACSDDSSSSTEMEEISSSSVVEGDINTEEPSDSLSSSEPDPETPSSSSAAPLKGVLVDDFEDGNMVSLLDEGWYTYTDEGNSGASTVSFLTDADGYWAAASEGYESSYSLSLSYRLDKGNYEFDPYVGWGLNVPASVNRNAIGGLSYWYKGGKHTVRVETSDITDHDVHSYTVNASYANWKLVTVRFQDLMQEGWGIPVDFKKENITAISFQAKGSSKVREDSLRIDFLYLMDTSEVAKDQPDMVIRAPEIPEVEIGDIAISNPLQEKAMKYLDKGVNFTNWLEEAKGRFAGFEGAPYGKEDVKNLADNGFKALRLPIDLDLYADNRDKFVAGTDSVLLMDTTTLWTVLDSFVNWTGEYGISLTIDYHEYDGSFSVESSADPQYRKMVANVWKTVAARYADNPREDIFYELLNEPGMNSNGKIKKENWTLTAQEMIDSIRAVDTKHTILFGDVQWYDIKELETREPFTDDNIVYVIHSYEPFVFTHQGASWGETATLKNIPFPYDSTKWSTFSSDFGVKKNTASWVKTAVKNYYKTGSKEYIINLILPAKKWAVTNNVPIIINEYGAYGLRADTESRLNYMRAMHEISDTLQIPMQHWGYEGGFSLFENGKLIDGMKEAMGL